MTQQGSRRSFLVGGASAAGALVFGAQRARPFARVEENPMENATPTAPSFRRAERVLPSGPEHWVGDGFRVHGMLSPGASPRLQSPFLLLDHASRRRFEPASHQRGVGEHPHRGFETVTLAYRGEIAHRDSSGGGGLIGAGDVQWMTAAGGVVHEELHSKRFMEEGGEMEMVQLWVNLPARHKRAAPGYQALLDKDFPRLDLGAARARLIAGELGAERGPASTFTPITLFDVAFSRAGEVDFELPKGFTTLLFNLEKRGAVGGQELPEGSLTFLARDGGGVRLRGDEGARFLVLAGEPIDEPVASYGPFVMNTREELQEAVLDYQSGKMGHL
jgi:quercetin 2,3-dioxygenase